MAIKEERRQRRQEFLAGFWVGLAVIGSIALILLACFFW